MKHLAVKLQETQVPCSSVVKNEDISSHLLTKPKKTRLTKTGRKATCVNKLQKYSKTGRVKYFKSQKQLSLLSLYFSKSLIRELNEVDISMLQIRSGLSRKQIYKWLWDEGQRLRSYGKLSLWEEAMVFMSAHRADSVVSTMHRPCYTLSQVVAPKSIHSKIQDLLSAHQPQPFTTFSPTFQPLFDKCSN